MKTILIPFKLAPNDGSDAGGGTSTTTTTDTTTDTKDEATKERERLQSEAADLRKRNKANEDRATKAENDLAELKKAGNKSSGDWQKVAGTLETEVAQLKARNTALTEGFKNTLVSGRLREEALKQGAKTDMVDLIDSMSFDEVEFSLDETNLRFNVKGVDVAVGNLKKLRPSFFDTKEAPKFNAGGTGGGAGGGGKPTLKDAEAKYIAALSKRGKDPEGFKKAHQDYQDAITASRKGA